jgi:hypothetical protein
MKFDIGILGNQPVATIVTGGTSADRQIEIFSKAKAAGRRRLTAIREVVDWVAAATLELGGAKT